MRVSIEPLGGTDALGADRRQARVRHRIRLRRAPGIAAGMRLRTATRTFAIHDAGCGRTRSADDFAV